MAKILNIENSLLNIICILIFEFCYFFDCTKILFKFTNSFFKRLIRFPRPLHTHMSRKFQHIQPHAMNQNRHSAEN